MRRLSRFKLVVTLLGAAGCTNPTAPLTSTALRLEQPLPTTPGSSSLRVATVSYHGELPLVEAPSTAAAGQPFEVAVTTYGGGCIGEDTTVVDVSGHGADVVPYQRIYRPPQGNFGCTLEMRVTRRQVHVVIGLVGQATVRVIGRASPGDTLVSAERSVSVR